MRVLVACEFSGIIREAFKERGHEAWSCDFLDTDILGRHIVANVLDIISFYKWDLMIAHPPCTYLSVAAANIKNHPGRKELREKATNFFMKLKMADIPKIAIENPVIFKDVREVVGEYSQLVRPYMFGHHSRKPICLWLKNLPELRPTNIIVPEPQHVYIRKTGPKKGQIVREYMGRHPKDRSKTFKGIAEAMAEQWG